MPKPARMRRGFTLVEVLVALSIMAVLATMAWQGIDGMVRARDISQARLDRSGGLASRSGARTSAAASAR